MPVSVLMFLFVSMSVLVVHFINIWPLQIHPAMEDLKSKAKAEKLWNLFLPKETDQGRFGAGALAVGTCGHPLLTLPSTHLLLANLIILILSWWLHVLMIKLC